MGVPPGNRPAVPRDWFRGVPERYVAGADNRGRREGRPYPWSQQVVHEISGLVVSPTVAFVGVSFFQPSSPGRYGACQMTLPFSLNKTNDARGRFSITPV
jgi:hypothetical protein